MRHLRPVRRPSLRRTHGHCSPRNTTKARAATRSRKKEDKEKVMPYKDPSKRQEMISRVRPKREPLGIVRNSAAHVLLLYMKMINRPVTPAEMREFNPKKFNSHTAETFKKMMARGFITQHDNGYMITQAGINIIYQMTIRPSTNRQPVD